MKIIIMRIMAHDCLHKIIWRLFLLLLLTFSQEMGQAQNQSPKKVYEIEEVEITTSRKKFYSEDQKIFVTDSLTIENNRSNNMDELIGLTTPVYIKSYGSRGSLSVPKLRGTQGAHTSVTWNGFPINSMTLGQSDLSLTPVEFVDHVSITHSAPGSLYGNGTFGGAIGLNNKTNWNKGNTLSLSGEAGSWNNQRYSLQSELGNQKFRYKASGFFQKARNDFEFHDTQQFGNPLKKRKNNGVQNFGVMQNFYYKLSPRNKFEAGVWYQEREKEIPEIMSVSTPGTALQKDSTLRLYGQWKRVFDESALQIRTGYFYHHQLYKEKEKPGDEDYMIYSPLETKKWMNDLNYRYYLNNRMSFDIGGQYSLIGANVNAYGKNIKEYRASLIGAFKYEIPRLTSNLTIRQQFNQYTKPDPQIGLGANYKLIPKEVYIRTHFSTKYRIPTLNDKYWQPGGNKDIKPERGWSGELGIGYSPDLNGTVQSFQSEITAFTSEISDLIQWVPSEGESYWHAINTSKVQSSGIEASADLSMKWNLVDLTLKSMYNYTRSMNLNEDKPEIHKNQLRYTPFHTVKNAFSSEWNNYSAGIYFNYTGKSFSTTDHSSELSPYATTDIFIKKQFEPETFRAEIKFTVKNLFDNQYQVIANYPMPGRAFYINLKIHLNKMIN
ncbi:MAG: TonB-dependent receptor [Bacteroidales bacterium]